MRVECGIAGVCRTAGGAGRVRNMDWTDILRTMLLAVYTMALAMVCLYGFHRYVLVWLYYRHRRRGFKPAGRFEQVPRVTIQLPMYNERYVAERIIEATCRIDWPVDRMQIQVLDDSTDETVRIVDASVARARAEGFDIEVVRRSDRTGFKAGALENGTKTATGDFLLIFDADFVPNPRVLREAMDFFTDPAICAVQTRWEHINRNDSLLTRSQAIYLDGHFAIEHVARNRSGRFMAFNGTAGIWRKSAIEDSGGWQHDTLTEDMDLSYRAQLRGWKFIFLPELTAPAELPPEMNAFKAQQFRWTKGGCQTAIKMLPRIFLSDAPLKNKIDAFFHLTCFSVHLYVVVLVTLLLPTMILRADQPQVFGSVQAAWDVMVFALATMSVSIFYVASQYELLGDWRTVFKFLPFLMSLGVGVSLSNAKAALEAFFGRQSEFVRTPKYGAGLADYKNDAIRRTYGSGRKRKLLPYLELAYGLYMAFGTVYCIVHPRFLMAVPFLTIFAVGFFYVGILSLNAHPFRRLRSARGPVTEAEPAGRD